MGEDAVIHEVNRALETVWSAALAGRSTTAPAPEPGLLAHAFVAQRWDQDHYAFIHAGAGLSAVHGRSLVDQNLFSLLRREDRAAVRDALEDAVRLGCPLILRTRGRRLDGGSLEFEATFWPLTGSAGAVDRVLGAFAPCVGAVGDRPVVEHAVDEITLMPRDASEPAPRARELARLIVAEMMRASAAAAPRQQTAGNPKP